MDESTGRSAEWLPPAALITRTTTFPDLEQLLARFEPIDLAEMDAVALLDRVDTKYVLGARQLYFVLSHLADDYRVLEVAGRRLSRYRTLYFDTDDFYFYRQHHSGKRVRCKVRSREYTDTHRAFLEVKWKGKRDHTVKTRVETPVFVDRWFPQTGALLGSWLPAEAQCLGPKVENEFCRATLVGKRHKERVTLDLGLCFHASGHAVPLPGLAIAEVKQDGVERGSPFLRQMREAGLRAARFSKYCTGVALLYPELKHNRFKPRLRLVAQLTRGEYHA